MPLDIEVQQHFFKLWSDIDEGTTFPDHRPLLAHYTGLDTVESILRNQSLWFSHPLFMNDLEELRFGVWETHAAFMTNEGIAKACKTPERAAILRSAYENIAKEFDQRGAFDIYIFCLSEYLDHKHQDGLLSMWRGYGANGGGAALVFDTSKLVVNEESPLIVSKVEYASSQDRRLWISKKLQEFVDLLESFDVEDGQLYACAHYLFQRSLVFALFTKHDGFLEEQEWRVVYLRSRDTAGKFVHMLDYHVTAAGIQPKLKLNLRDQVMVGLQDGLDGLVHKILLGPSNSTELHALTVERMLEKLNKPQLKEKVFKSSTPYRATR